MSHQHGNSSIYVAYDLKFNQVVILKRRGSNRSLLREARPLAKIGQLSIDPFPKFVALNHEKPILSDITAAKSPDKITMAIEFFEKSEYPSFRSIIEERAAVRKPDEPLFTKEEFFLFLQGLKSVYSTLQNLSEQLKANGKISLNEITHNDLKPENILLNFSNTTRPLILLDWETGDIEEFTENNEVVHFTEYYEAPERNYKQNHEIDWQKSEVFSVRLLIFEFIMGSEDGKDVFYTTNGLSSSSGVKTNLKNFLKAMNYEDNVAENIIQLLESGLKYDPNHRPDKVLDFIKNLIATVN